MKKYDTYKSSEIEWLDVIPDNWRITRLKYLGKLYGGLTGKSGQDFKNEDNPKNRPYIPYTNIFNNTYISNEHYHYVLINEGENQNRVKKFDLFFLMSSETHQDLGKSCVLIDEVEELYLNSFCKGLRILSKEVNPLFLNYQLLGHLHKELLSVEGKGFTRINLRQDKVNDLIIFLPPLQEQEQIVIYLDQKTSIIDKLISTKERKIELLIQQRNSLVNEVITKGLDSNVKMKNSGVEWIGDIPQNWLVCKLKLITSLITDGSHFSPTIEYEGKYYISVSDITKNQSINFENCKKISESSFDELEKNGCRPKTRDILITKDGTIGRGCIVGDFNDFVILSSLGLIRLNQNQNEKYVLYYLLSQLNISQMYSHIRGSGITRLTIKLIKDLLIIVPSHKEQQEIVDFLDKQTKEIDDLVQLEQKKIETLKEYRQSLISEVITGKIKVVK
jgi:type I restriction enzyme S subunit